MSEENRTSTRQFVQIGDVLNSGESVSEGDDNFRSQLLDRRLSSSEVDRRMNAIVAPLAMQSDRLIKPVGELSEKIRTDRLKGMQHLNDQDRWINVSTFRL